MSIASDLGSIVDDASCGGPGCLGVLDFAALPNTDGVGTVTFGLAGPGAIDDLTVTPLPGAVVLFASALVALGLWRRHRAA